MLWYWLILDKMDRWSGNVCLVTGASAGLGAEFVKGK